MRIAVIGAGSIGKRHLANVRALGHEAVVIDTRSSVRDWARAEGYETHDVDAYTALDAVVIATPAPSHLHWLQECAERHLPVLVEKPLGILTDLPALRELRPAAPVMVGYQLRFHPEVRRIQPLLSKSAAGLFTCWCDSRTWPGSAGQGDMLLELSHEIDLALHVGAEPVMTGARMPSDHEARLTLGAFTVDLSDLASIYRREWRILDHPRDPWHVVFPSLADYDRIATDLYRDELGHFLRAVEGGPIAPGCTLEEGIAVLDVVQQVKALETVTK